MEESSWNGKDQERVRNIAFELYEDSCSVIWRETLEGMHVKCFWIYHDKDVRGNGETKKPHYHVMVMYGNQVRKAKVRQFVTMLGAANNHYEVVQSVPGYARYLCHLDSPEKHRYPIESVRELGGANYRDVIGQAKEDKLGILDEILDFCDEENIEWYGSLVRHCRKNNREWLEALLDARYGRMVQDYIKSEYWRKRSD